MSGGWNAAKRWLLDEEGGLGKTAVGRLLLVLPFFLPFDWAFDRIPFHLSDVDPDLLAYVNSKGVDLADPAVWPTRLGLLGRLGLVALACWLLWALLGFLLKHAAGRWGASLLTVGGYILLAIGAGWLAMHLAGRVLPPGEGNYVVWGGYVRTSLLKFGEVTGRIVLLFQLGGLLDLTLLALRTQGRLLAAQEGALRGKLAPHFLFNTLNTLHAQIESDPRGAQVLTERLAGLFRQVLAVTERATVSLREELAFVEDYLGIERARLGARLQVRIDVPEALLDCQVPVLALQVLAENAIKHGVAPREEGGLVTIAAALEGRRLRVSVEDPGNGHSKATGTGSATANLRSRLGRSGSLVLEPTGPRHRAVFTFLQARG